MKATQIPALSLLLTALVGYGCPAEPPPPPPPPPPPAKAPEPPPPPAPIADPSCMAKWSTDGEPQTVSAGDRTFEKKGAQLTETSSDEDDTAVFGVLANIKEDTAENLSNLDQFLEFFKAKKVDAIVVAGDLGEKSAQIEKVLSKVAGSKLPVFTIIGNLESRAEYATALAAVSARHPQVIDMNQTRLASLDDVAVVSVPGYHNKVYIHAEDGCEYGPGDLEATKAIIKAAGSKTVVLLSHSPPLQEGADALDRTLEQANVGDPALQRLIDDTGVRFGIAPNIHEAGGRATDLAGSKLVPPAEFVDTLFLNPGAADAVAWKMNDGTESIGMAAVLTVKGRQASFEIKRIEAAAPKAAKKKKKKTK